MSNLDEGIRFSELPLEIQEVVKVHTENLNGTLGKELFDHAKSHDLRLGSFFPFDLAPEGFETWFWIYYGKFDSFKKYYNIENFTYDNKGNQEDSRNNE